MLTRPLLSLMLLLAPVAARAACPASATSAAFVADGRYAAGMRTLALVDTSRSVAAYKSQPGSASRPLLVDVWYPASAAGDSTPLAHGGPFPLVINSPGLGDNRTGEQYYLRSLATRGFVAASIDFPRTNLSSLLNADGPDLTDLQNQPGDVSFVIDQLLALGKQRGGWLARGVDRKRIGVAGLSLGGATTMIVTFHPKLRDRRIRAALPIAAAGGCGLGDEFFRAARPPLLILHGDQDLLVPFDTNAVPIFDLAHSARQLVRLKDASHTGFVEFATSFRPGTNYDLDAGCPAISHVAEWGDPFTGIAGPGTGVDGQSSCLLPCQGPPPSVPPMPATRQHAITTSVVNAFFESTLHHSGAARCFLRERLDAENDDVQVQSAPRRALRGH